MKIKPQTTKLLKKNKQKSYPKIEHFIIEIYNVESNLLGSCENTLPLIKRFIKKTQLKVVNKIYHNFKPLGNTLVFILASSHLAVHTWPEYNYIHLDLVSCQELKDATKLRGIISEIFRTNQFKITKVNYCEK